jgi:hypothetical protein
MRPAHPVSDPALDVVEQWLLGQVGDPTDFFGHVVRKSIDEVLDGPRTGRWDYEQLEKTEKTYVGTKLEIIARTELGLEPTPPGCLDLDIEGNPVDVKWSGTSKWMIPREAVNQLCLCLGATGNMTQFQVGLVRCTEDKLTQGPGNQDRKRTLSSAGSKRMRTLVIPSSIPPNFVADMDADVRAEVMAQKTIQERITRLFELMPGVPIPRNAVRTIALTEGDPMRRLRADKGDPLRGYKVLSERYAKKIVRALGYPPMRKDEFMAVPTAQLESLDL